MKPVIAQPIVVEMNSTKFRPTCVAMFSGLKSCCKIKDIHRIMSKIAFHKKHKIRCLRTYFRRLS